ncbi:MAG: pyrroline-5-carboxylate reductase [Actinomycetota bacterium]|nr:pyrroline-5-carboxylate reductase [Actinomycetota bacterium]
MSRVALIGAGNMGECMLAGWLEAGVKGNQILVSDRDATRMKEIRGRYGVSVADSNSQAASSSGLIFLAVKPQDSIEVLNDICQYLGSGKTLVSIVAGLPIDRIRSIVGEESLIVRVMPNIAAKVGAAVCAYAVSGENKDLLPYALKLIAVMGETVEIEESWMNLVTAVSGSGPAYFFYLVEALEDAGAKQGLPVNVARHLARETFWGTAKFLKETGVEATEGRRAVSSPGGTTVAALEVFDRKGFKEIIMKAVEAARERAEVLAS